MNVGWIQRVAYIIAWPAVIEAWEHKPGWISQLNRPITHITIKIDPAAESNGVLTDEPAHSGAIEPGAIVVDRILNRNTARELKWKGTPEW